MKVSLQLIRFMNMTYACGEDPAADGVDALLHRIGTQLGAIEEVKNTGEAYEGIVVAKVVSCDKHPNADTLHVCRIDDGGTVADVERGDDGFVQVVCGAPNVRKGMTVAWLPPGTVVPSSRAKDPFTLEVREIRGEKSNGMLASPAELAIGDSHEGLLEISAHDVGDELTRPGTAFKKLYGLDDVIIDMENKMFTHRPDCFGTIGVAREFAGIAGKAYVSPEWYKQPLVRPLHGQALPLRVVNDVPNQVLRFMAQIVKDIKIGPSPWWLQSYLSRIGLRPINNVVDYTNFFMLETGQPLHAFDYDKIISASGDTPTLGPRQAREGEELALLNGKTIKLHTEDIVIATDKQAVALAGVMGGLETEVDADTTRIILECATFDMYAVRRTSMRHGLFTDAVTRYTKGQSPLQNDRVLAKMVDELLLYAHGAVGSEPFDVRSDKVVAKPAVGVSTSFINDRLGSSLATEDMARLLRNVEIGVAVDGDQLTISPPFWRTDLEIPEDIVEEVGRLYGFDKLAVALPRRSSSPVLHHAMIEFKTLLRETLANAGANEVLTYSFVHGNVLQKAGQTIDQAYELTNALSPDLQYYRLSITPSILDKVQQNIRSDMIRSEDNEFALFEIGKSHNKLQIDEDGLPLETQRLAVTFHADEKTAARKYNGSPYYQARQYLGSLEHARGLRIALLPVLTADSSADDTQLMAPFEPARSAFISIEGQRLGVIGEYSASVKTGFKLPAYSAGFELDIDKLLKLVQPPRYIPVTKFPKVQQDITLRVPDTLAYGELFDFVETQLAKLQPANTVATLKPLTIYQAEGSNEHKHVSLRLWLSAQNRTLKTEEVNTLLDAVAATAKDKFGAERL